MACSNRVAYSLSGTLFVLISVTACISNPKPCALDSAGDGPDDPLTAIRCDVGGGFDAVIEGQKQRLREVQTEIEITALEARSLEGEAVKLDGQVKRYHKELDTIKSDLKMLREKLVRLSPAAENKRALRTVLLGEIRNLQETLKVEKAKDRAIKEEIIKFRKEVDRRRSALKSLTLDVLQQ